MSDFDDALTRLDQYSGDVYDPVTNPYGFSGEDGVPTNWVRCLRDVSTAARSVRTTYSALVALQTAWAQAAPAGTIIGRPAAAGTGPMSALSAPYIGVITAATQAASRAAMGLGAMATQAASAVAVTGGSIDGTTIGATTPVGATVTTLTATGGAGTYGIQSNQAIIVKSNVGAVGLYIQGRSDNIGSITFQNQAGTTVQGSIVSWSDRVIFNLGSTEYLKFQTGGILFSQTVRPSVDATYDLGSANYRLNNIYASTAAINTSDARLKTDVADTPLGLDFIRALHPVRFRFKDIDEPEVKVSRAVERPVTRSVERTREEVRLVDGLYRLVSETETVDEPVTREVPLHATDGTPLLDAEGKPRKATVPVMESVQVDEVTEPARALTFKRPHDGLIAQEVKAVLDKLGLDAGAYIHDVDTDSYGLRYAELIAPLVKAIQELAARVDAIKTTTA